MKVVGGSHVKLEDGKANLQCCGQISYRNKTTAPLYIRKRHTAKHINTKSRQRDAKDAYVEHAIFYYF